ncbi:NAD-dependent glyceraldehyde-3-phosphate dehydrogenase [Klebsiella pneumoniae]|nr:NAD-dependent glyceraldehyde-3-phosphate dehydrogenase [Klebsiella pneumoniae]
MVKVGINGFGRIGRNVLRAALNNPDIQIVAINDLTDSKTLAHLLKYDSLLGKLDAEVTAGEGGLVVDGKPITVFSERNPASIPWRQCEVDIVIEATGLFTDREKAAVHIHSGGAKRVIISAPGKNDDLTIVMGVNESLYSPDKHYVISNGSCTTNGLAPAAQVLHQHFGIKHGLRTPPMPTPTARRCTISRKKICAGLVPPHCRLCLTPAAQRTLWVKLFLSWMGV